MQRNEAINSKFKGLIELFAFILLGFVGPYGPLLTLWYLGILIVRDFSPAFRLGVAPAVGMGLAVVVIHILSLLGISLRYSPLVVFLIVTAMWVKRGGKPILYLTLRDMGSRTKLIISSAVLLSAGTKIPFIQVPAYPGAVGADAIFHAYKAWEILKEDTVFINGNPIHGAGFTTYPAGYHSLVAWISLSGNVEVPFAMMALKLFTWILIPLGTYAAASQLFGKRPAEFSALVSALAFLYYYYLHYSLLHMFLDYYLFLSTLALLVEALKIEDPFSRPYHILLLVLTAATLLMTHPYPYLMFQALALFLVLSLLMSIKSVDIKPVGVFLVQSLGSFSLYYILEYPMRLKVTHYTKPLFHTPGYAFKDNPHWVIYILRETFVNNGQFVFIIPTLLAAYVALKKRHWGGVGLLLAFVFNLFLIANKIWFTINIPFYSAIWSSERIYVLLTPILPLLYGFGLDNTLRATFSRRALALGIATIILVPGIEVNLLNYSHEICSTIEGDALTAIERIQDMSGPIYIQDFKDSGPWIPVLTRKDVIPVKEPPEGGVLYVDSRGFGDIKIGPINPLELLNKSELVYYNNGIWMFNLSSRPLGPQIPDDFKLSSNRIRGYRFEDWKFFVYGFILRHPVVVHGILTHEWRGIFSRSNSSYVVFIPNKNYSGIFIDGLGDSTSVFLNGVKIGNLEKPTLFEVRIKGEEPQIIEFNGTVYIREIILQG